MRIGLVSDTHLPRFGTVLPAPLERGLREAGVQAILHGGDFTEPFVPALFEAIAPFDGIAGNNDPPEIVAAFGRRKIVELGGARIGMIHGDGMRGSTLQRAVQAFSPEEVDVILFGHSHDPYQGVHGGVLVVNPGSPTDRRRQPRFSFAVLTVADGAVSVTQHFYDAR